MKEEQVIDKDYTQLRHEMLLERLNRIQAQGELLRLQHEATIKELREMDDQIVKEV
jgi:hypothetical protein